MKLNPLEWTKPVIIAWITSLGLTIAGAIGTFAYTMYSDFRTTEAAVIAHEAKLTDQQQQLNQNSQIMQRIDITTQRLWVNSLTVKGYAKVVPQGDSTCIMINEASRASWYADQTRARITNLSSSEQPSIVVNIAGKFQDVGDEAYLLKMSEKCGNIFDIRIGQQIKVKIEPVEDE